MLTLFPYQSSFKYVKLNKVLVLFNIKIVNVLLKVHIWMNYTKYYFMPLKNH